MMARVMVGNRSEDACRWVYIRAAVLEKISLYSCFYASLFVIALSTKY